MGRRELSDPLGVFFIQCYLDTLTTLGFEGGHIVLVDISAESVAEAKRRLAPGSALHGRAASRKIDFAVEDCFQPQYWQRFEDGTVSVISCQFALHYAFGDVSGARQLMREIRRVLAPGVGMMFGTAVDTDALAHAAQHASADDLFCISEFPTHPQLGDRYVFSLPGHVEPTAEYVLPMGGLRNEGEASGLKPYEHRVTWKRFQEIVDMSQCGDKDRRLSSLYYTFAFVAPLLDSTVSVGSHQLAPSGPIAVYTGTFDPIHVNHLNLCRYLVKDLGFAQVRVFPNDDSPLKPFATPLEHRAAMARLALQQEGLAETCTVAETRGLGGDWHARELICREAATHGTPVVLLLGQDSFEKAVSRCGGAGVAGRSNKPRTGKAPSGIFRFAQSGFRILVCLRDGYGTTEIPTELQGCVEVVEGYRDVFPTSSSAIREELMRSSCHEATGIEGVPDAVLSYIRKHRLYQPVASRRRTVFVLGPPGSGKTTLAKKLAECIHGGELLSWNDRGAKELKEAIQSNDSRCFFVDGGDVDDLHIFERTFGSIDCIIELHCCKSTVVLRCEQAGNDASKLVTRYNRYLSRISIQKEILKSFAGAGRLHLHLREDSDCPDVETMCNKVLEQLTSAGWELQLHGRLAIMQ